MMHASLFSRGGATRQCAKPINRFACTIRAYPTHAKELNNPVPESLHFFHKPAASFYQLKNGGVVPIPTRPEVGNVAHEIELCVLMGDCSALPKAGDEAAARFDPRAVRKSIEGLGLGLDWTLREVQQKLAKEGLPWERAKAFTRSAAITDFMDMTKLSEAEQEQFLGPLADTKGIFPTYKYSLNKNGTQVQEGNTDLLSFNVLSQIWEMHQVCALQQGDIIMTGTPAGVGTVAAGDELEMKCDKLGIDYKVKVIPESQLL